MLAIVISQAEGLFSNPFYIGLISYADGSEPTILSAASGRDLSEGPGITLIAYVSASFTSSYARF